MSAESPITVTVPAPVDPPGYVRPEVIYLRIPPAFKQRILARANKEEKSINQFLIDLIEKQFAEDFVASIP